MDVVGGPRVSFRHLLTITIYTVYKKLSYERKCSEFDLFNDNWILGEFQFSGNNFLIRQFLVLGSLPEVPVSRVCSWREHRFRDLDVFFGFQSRAEMEMEGWGRGTNRNSSRIARDRNEFKFLRKDSAILGKVSHFLIQGSAAFCFFLKLALGIVLLVFASSSPVQVFNFSRI
jgi:hypothetical protein